MRCEYIDWSRDILCVVVIWVLFSFPCPRTILKFIVCYRDFELPNSATRLYASSLTSMPQRTEDIH